MRAVCARVARFSGEFETEIIAVQAQAALIFMQDASDCIAGLRHSHARNCAEAFAHFYFLRCTVVELLAPRARLVFI